MNTKIKNAGAFTFAALLAGTTMFGMVGPASAHTMKHQAAAATEAVPAGENSPLDQAIRSWNGGEFSVISERDLPKHNAANIQLVTSTGELEGFKAAIAANPALAAKIESQNVSIRDISGVERALDGGLIFYTM